MNNENVYRQIYANPRFQELVAKRGRFAWLLSLVMLAAYFAFILVIAFDPKVWAFRWARIPSPPGASRRVWG